MNWREEWKRYGRPKVRRGTPPTPEDPAPSNETIREYPNGISIISTGNLTPTVCAEYEGAIAAHPDGAGLRLSYGELLTFASRLDEALPQLQAAVRLSPGDSFAHGALSGCLRELGRLDEAEVEQRESLRIILADRGPRSQQGEAIARWGLSELLEQTGRREEARRELAQAVAVQRKALSRGAASP